MDNGYHKVWHREALWGSSISKISTILLIVCLVLLPNYNNHVTGVPPPVEAHGYKVELEKPFVCAADGQFPFHDMCKAIDILSFYPENKRCRDMFDKLWLDLIQSKDMTTEIVITLPHFTRGRKSVDCWVHFINSVEIFCLTVKHEVRGRASMNRTPPVRGSPAAWWGRAAAW